MPPARVAGELEQILNQTFPKSIWVETDCPPGVWNVMGIPCFSISAHLHDSCNWPRANPLAIVRITGTNHHACPNSPKILGITPTRPPS